MSDLDLRRDNWRLNMSEFRQVVKNETPSDPRYEYNYQQIEPIYTTVESSVVMIGTSSNSARPYWFLGAFVSRFVYVSPSTSEQFIAGVQANETKRVGLDRLTILEFPKYNIDSYVLAIQPPYWLEDIYIEVWEYIGIESTTIQDELVVIRDNLSNLNSRFDTIEDWRNR